MRFSLAEQIDELFRGQRQGSVAAIYDADRPYPVFFGEFDDCDGSSISGLDNCGFGNDRETEANLDRTLYRLDIIELRNLGYTIAKVASTLSVNVSQVKLILKQASRETVSET